MTISFKSIPNLKTTEKTHPNLTNLFNQHLPLPYLLTILSVLVIVLTFKIDYFTITDD